MWFYTVFHDLIINQLWIPTHEQQYLRIGHERGAKQSPDSKWKNMKRLEPFSRGHTFIPSPSVEPHLVQVIIYTTFTIYNVFRRIWLEKTFGSKQAFLVAIYAWAHKVHLPLTWWFAGLFADVVIPVIWWRPLVTGAAQQPTQTTMDPPWLTVVHVQILTSVLHQLAVSFKSIIV